jgi:signal transduction histidine kinase
VDKAIISDQSYLKQMEHAKQAYHTARYDVAETTLDDLLEHLKDPDKRASAYELKVIINNRLGHYRKALLILQQGLEELGVDIPMEDTTIQRDLGELTAFLQSNGRTLLVSDEEVHRQKAVLRLLMVGGMSLHHTSSGLMTWGALQIIRWSAVGPEAGETAMGYVVYGRVRMIDGFIDEGFSYGLKALKVNNDLNGIAQRCRVYGIFAFFILPWKKPFAESRKYLEEAYEAGMKAGDSIGCYIIKTHQLNFRILSGDPLDQIASTSFGESTPDKELTYYITHYQKNLIKFLTGKSTVFSIPRIQPRWLAATNTIQEEKFYRYYVWSRYYFLFGYYELSEHAACEANKNRKLQEGSPLTPSNYFIWFLAISQNWINYDETERSKFKPVLEDILSTMQRWAAHSPANYQACHLLLSAEFARIQEEAAALNHYAAALEKSGDNLWYKAIISECRAKHLLAFPDKRSEARVALAESIDFYEQWGAQAKVSQLRQQYHSILSTNDLPSDSINIEMIQHELSGDLEVESLVKKLMILCLRISGSTRVIMESVGEKLELNRLGKYSLIKLETFSNEAHDRFSFGVLESFRMRLNSEATDSRMNSISDDAHPVKSYLILPVSIREHLSFVLYMESVFAPFVYTDEIVKWIKITVNQGAVIIENARIHEVTLKLNEQIREKMEETEQLISEIKSQKDLHLQALEQMQNDERRRIASDLHDSLGAILSGVRLRFNSLEDDFGKAVPTKASRFKDTVALLDDAVHELRRIVHNMLPVSLNRFGLRAALSTFVDQINEAGELAVELQVLGLDERLSDEYEMTLYRICQELVQNVIKHSGATTLRIQMIRHGDAINLIVEDNGHGVEITTIREGLGLMTIQSKVSMMKGNFSIESHPGKGTMVLIDLPITP